MSRAESYLITSKDKSKIFKAIVNHMIKFSYGCYIQPFVNLTVNHGILEKTVSLLERLLESGNSEMFQTLVNLIPTLGNEKINICYTIFSEKSPDYTKIHTDILNAVFSSQVTENKVLSRVAQYVVKFEPDQHFGLFINQVLFKAFSTSNPNSCARWFYLKLFRHVYLRLSINNPNDANAIKKNLRGFIDYPSSGKFTLAEVQLAKKAIIKTTNR